jgi:tetratricopeptide (TPR) repeat protein
VNGCAAHPSPQVLTLRAETCSLFIEITSALLEESLAFHREGGNKAGMAHALWALASALFDFQGSPSTIRALLEESLALSQEVGDKEASGSCFSLSGKLALSQGDIATARRLLEKSLAINREIGNREHTADSLFHLARMEVHQGDNMAARALYEESLAMAARGGDSKGLIPSCLEALADVAAAQGEFAWAARLLGRLKLCVKRWGRPCRPSIVLPMSAQSLLHAPSLAGRPSLQRGSRDEP